MMFDTDGRPLHVPWRYSRAELVADGIVHALGLGLGLIGVVTLICLAALWSNASGLASVSLYATSLLAMLAVSAAYNLWPVSRTKWRLRRVDHALIFVLIAATYTPFLTRLPPGWDAAALSAGVWAAASIGACLKLVWPGRFDRLSLLLYLALGFSGLLAWETVSAALPSSTLWLIGAGGLIYAAGVVFHVWEGLRFQNAVWHGFVLVASGLFYGAVLDGVVLA